MVREAWLGGLALLLALPGYGCSKERPSKRPPDAAGGASSSASGAGPAGATNVAGGDESSGGARDAATPRPAITDLLGDAAAWETIDTLPSCSTRVARAPAKTWPALSYTSCGPGCRRANVLPTSEMALGALLGTSARVVDGQLRLTISARVAGTTTMFVLATYGIASPSAEGTPLAVLAETGACFAQVAGRASPNLYKLFPLNGDEVFRLAWLGESLAPKLSWLPQAPTTSLELFDTGSRWGGIESFSAVQLASSTNSLEMDGIYESMGTLRTPAGSDGAAVWSEWRADSGQGQVLGWVEERGVVTLAKGAWVPARVAVSTTRLAWIGATGARALEGSYDSAELHGCRRSSPIEACEPDKPLPLPISSSSGILSVSDRWSAFTGCSATSCEVLVADRSNSSLYRVKPEKGHGIEVLGVSETELFAADFGAETHGTPDFDAILRFELSQIESFGTKL